MASIQIQTLKPQIGKLKIKHPFNFTEEFIPEVKDLDGNVITEAQLIKHPITEFDLPDGSKGPLEIWLVGRNSQQWLDFMRKIKANGSNEKSDLFSKITEEAHEFVASLIVGWLDNGAIDVPYSKEEAFNLISSPDNIWILEQLQVYILDETNFFLKN
jgi:hypothetical protein